MKRRCQSPAEPNFALYGARGIKVCPEWQTFVGFLDWALMSEYGAGKVLDRIDSDGDYAPDNCRWTTPELNSARMVLPRSGEAARQSGRLTDEALDAQRTTGSPTKLYDGGGSRVTELIIAGGAAAIGTLKLRSVA